MFRLAFFSGSTPDGLEGDEHFVASRRYALDGEWPYSRYSFQSTWYLGPFCVSIGIPVSACVYRPVMFATHDEVDRSFSGYAMVYMACGKSESQWLLTLNRTDGRCTAIPTLNLCFVSSGQVPENAMQLSFLLFPNWWFQNCPCKLSQTQPSWEKMIKLTCMMFHMFCQNYHPGFTPGRSCCEHFFGPNVMCFVWGKPSKALKVRLSLSRIPWWLRICLWVLKSSKVSGHSSFRSEFLDVKIPINLQHHQMVNHVVSAWDFGSKNNRQKWI